MIAPIPIDFSNAWKSGARILNTAIAMLPNFVIALVILVAFLILGATLKSIVRSFSQRRQYRRNLSLLLGQVVYTVVVVLGFLIALSVVAPSFQAADLIKMLGIGSVAVGFAFQNILQNFLAGILLLIQEPFVLGDWISVTGIEGKVEDIQARATVVLTSEGKHVVIPNAVLFTNPVAVGQTKKSAEPEPTQEPSAATTSRAAGAQS